MISTGILMTNLTAIAMGLLNLWVIITLMINLMIGNNTLTIKDKNWMTRIEMVIPPVIKSLAYLISVYAMA